MHFSEDQLRIAEALKTSDVVVNAVAGSGKTTSIACVIEKMSDVGRTSSGNVTFSPLILTYNRRLMLETSDRLRKRGLQAEVRTFHSFAKKYLCENAEKDTELYKFIKRCDGDALKSSSLLADIPQYDMIFVDEAQDLRWHLYKLVLMIIDFQVESYGARPRLCILGDVRQRIYEYANATDKYMMNPERYFGGAPWTRLGLKKTFRVTRQVAGAVNEMIGSEYLISERDGPQPIYLHAKDIASICEFCANVVTKYKPENVFILAPSLRRHIPKAISASLVSRGVPVYVPDSDDGPINISVTTGKVVFSSFHQAKGLERRAVIVLNFDYDHSRITNYKTFTNELYVALTRSRSLLCVVQDGTFYKQLSPLPFFNISSQHFKFLGREVKPFQEMPAKATPSSYSVTDLLKNINTESILYLMRDVKYTTKDTSIEHNFETFDLPAIAKSRRDEDSDNNGEHHTEHIRGTAEAVSNISGTAIPAYWEYRTTRTSTNGIANGGHCCKIFDELRRLCPACNEEYCPKHRIDDTNGVVAPDPARFLELTTNYCSMVSEYYFKDVQISQFDWITSEMFEKMADKLEIVVGGAASNQFEVPLGDLVHGRADIVQGTSNSTTIWELKCCALSDVHILQTLIYGYLWAKSAATAILPTMKLFSVTTNELIDIEPMDVAAAAKIIADLILLYNDNTDMRRIVRKYAKGGCAPLPTPARLTALG